MTSVIALDGPAASGKSTLAAKLAERLNIPYINTGNMYRAITYFALQSKLDLTKDCNEKVFKELLTGLKFEYHQNDEGKYEIVLNGVAPGAKLRSPEVAKFVSPVAALPVVRNFLTAIQRQCAAKTLVVMEGRDIGSVVFPDAQYKFFITASPLERARRRLAQAGEVKPGETLDSVAAAIAERDRIDSTRAVAPLKKADDAILIDNTDLQLEDVLSMVIARIKK